MRERPRMVSTYLERPLAQRLEQYACERERSLSSLTRLAVREFLDTHEADPNHNAGRRECVPA